MFEWNADLEAAIRDDPDDESRWSVLEDWLLERGDARAEHVKLTKARATDDAVTLMFELAPLLLGVERNYKGLLAAVGGSTWRCGYIDHCQFDAPPASRLALLRELLDNPAAALIRQLRINIDYPAELRDLPAILTRAKALRRLLVATYWKPAKQEVTFDATALEPLALDELRFTDRALHMPYAPPLARLRRLAIVPGAASDLQSLFVHGGFPSLVHLDLGLEILEHRGWKDLVGLERVLACEAAPHLEHVNVICSDARFTAFLDELAASPLAPKLRRLDRRYSQISHEKLGERHLVSLGHVCS